VKARPPLRRAFVLSALGVGLVSVVDRAHGDERPPLPDKSIAVSVSGCTPVFAERLLRVLAIEVGPGAVVGPALDVCERLTVECQGNARAHVVAERPCAPGTLERTVNLEAFPGDASPRATALTGLELLEALGAPLREPPSPPPPVAERAPPPVEEPREVSSSVQVSSPSRPEVASATSQQLRLEMAPAARVFVVDHGARTWGGQVRASLARGDHGLFGADLDVTDGHRDLGGVGRLRASLFSLGLSLGARTVLGSVEASLEGGARMGLARMAGSSADAEVATGATVWRPWGGPLLRVGLARPFGRLRLWSAAEVGRTLFAASGLAGEDAIITVEGTWVALFLGGGWAL